MKIKKRNTCLEIFDTAPVTDFDGELSLFLSYMVSRGFKLQNPAMGRNIKPLTVQVSHALEYISRRLPTLESVRCEGARLNEAFLNWIKDSLIVDAEPYSPETHRDKPIGGIACASYLGLRMSNVGAIRERYWGAFSYLALATDLEVQKVCPSLCGLTGVTLHDFLSRGLKITCDQDSGGKVWWNICPDPSIPDSGLLDIVITNILSGEDTPPPQGFSLPRYGTRSGALKVDRNHYVGSPSRQSRLGFQSFLCPGSVILMRRAISSILEEKQIARDKTYDLLKTALSFHIWLYYRRSFFVLNSVHQTGQIPPCCTKCWSKFQDDLIPTELLAEADRASRRERWSAGDYRAAGTEENACFVTETCQCPQMFFNLGPKENRAATDMAISALQHLYQEQDHAVLNRTWLGHLIELMSTGQMGPREIWLDRIISGQDEEKSKDLVLLIVNWLKREVLIDNAETPDSWRKTFNDIIMAEGINVPVLLNAVREFIAQDLAPRDFSRYHEVLNSMMGGGELPTNENPRGMLARSGNSQSRFYPTLLRGSLELMVFLFTKNSFTQARSFSEFVKFLSGRYGISCNEIPSEIGGTNPVAIQACDESRSALRERLRAAGYLWEFSDSEEWNQVRWTRELHYER